MKTGTRTIKIREQTEYEELIGIKREWVHPLRHLYNNSLYYDIAILELGKNNMSVQMKKKFFEYLKNNQLVSKKFY